MEKYKLLEQVGQGTFGSVGRAINRQTGEVVAIKKMKKKYYSWQECLNLKEVKSLQKMNHPNIVMLKEVIRESHTLYFVFEYMECNLFEVIKGRKKPFPEAEVRNLCFQVFHALAYMNQKGYFHRDLKPENLLVTNDIIKIADFGLAKEIGSQPPYTEYVSTRWYRAPEVMLQSYLYSSKVDMWAMGAIMAELFTLRPLFPGTNEADEMYKICNVIGSPTMDSWADGLHLAEAINYQFPKFVGSHLSAIIPTASEDAISLITLLCSWNPCNRPTAMEALQHPFFRSCFYIPPSLQSRAVAAATPQSAGTKGALEQQCARMYRRALSNSKLSKNFPSAMCKLGSNKNDKCLNSNSIQLGFQPPRKSPPSVNKGKSTTHVVSETADKLATMTIGSRRQFVEQPMPLPLKGGVRGIPGSGGMFLIPSQQFLPGRVDTKQVATYKDGLFGETTVC